MIVRVRAFLDNENRERLPDREAILFQEVFMTKDACEPGRRSKLRFEVTLLDVILAGGVATMIGWIGIGIFTQSPPQTLNRTVEVSNIVFGSTAHLLREGALPENPASVMMDGHMLPPSIAYPEPGMNTGSRVTLRVSNGGPVFGFENGPQPGTAVVSLNGLRPDLCASLRTFDMSNAGGGRWSALPLAEGKPVVFSTPDQALRLCEAGKDDRATRSVSWLISPKVPPKS